MTDRIQSITLTLGEDIRDEDAELMVSTLYMLRGVIKVEPNVSTGGSVMNEHRVARTMSHMLHTLADEMIQRTPSEVSGMIDRMIEDAKR